LWIAWGTWQQIRSGVMFKAKNDDEVVALEPREILSRSLLINLASPGPYIFWGTVNGPLLLDGLQQSVWHGLSFLVGFYGTFFVGLGTLGFVFGTAGRLNPRVTRVVMYVAVVLIVVFALQFIGRGLGLIA
jgi:threonine/homoserine/homoserine lactone efflux protein